jgi:hypothetical protein
LPRRHVKVGQGPDQYLQNHEADIHTSEAPPVGSIPRAGLQGVTATPTELSAVVNSKAPMHLEGRNIEMPPTEPEGLVVEISRAGPSWLCNQAYIREFAIAR